MGLWGVMLDESWVSLSTDINGVLLWSAVTQPSHPPVSRSGRRHIFCDLQMRKLKNISKSKCLCSVPELFGQEFSTQLWSVTHTTHTYINTQKHNKHIHTHTTQIHIHTTHTNTQKHTHKQHTQKPQYTHIHTTCTNMHTQHTQLHTYHTQNAHKCIHTPHT